MRCECSQSHGPRHGQVPAVRGAWPCAALGLSPLVCQCVSACTGGDCPLPCGIVVSICRCSMVSIHRSSKHQDPYSPAGSTAQAIEDTRVDAAMWQLTGGARRHHRARAALARGGPHSPPARRAASRASAAASGRAPCTPRAARRPSTTLLEGGRRGVLAAAPANSPLRTRGHAARVGEGCGFDKEEGAQHGSPYGSEVLPGV